MRKLKVRSSIASRNDSQDFAGIYTSVEELVRLSVDAKRLAFPKTRRAKRPQTGSHHSRFKGRGMEFAEVRAYQPGDDVRSIDWRVTARRQKAHTKLFQEERERPVMILCDQSASMFFGSSHCFKSVFAAQIAALLAWSALAHNDRVGGIVFSDGEQETIKPARNRKSVLRLLQAITRLNNTLSIDQDASPTTQYSLNICLQEFCQVVKPGSLVFVISDFLTLDAESTKHLSRLAEHNDLVLLKCSDQLEQTLPESETLPIKDEQQTFFLDTRSGNTKQAMTKLNQALSEQLEYLEKAHQAKLWNLSNNHDLTSQLRAIAQQVGRGK